MKLKYISRIDSANTHGWWVRVGAPQQSSNSSIWQKFFSDLSCNSKDWAYFKAIIYSAKLLEKRDALKKRATFKFNEKRNSYEVWYKKYATNQWTCASFSIKKYGEEEAARRARRSEKQVNNTKRNLPNNSKPFRTKHEKEQLISFIDLNKSNRDLTERLNENGIKITKTALALFLYRNGFKRDKEQLLKLKQLGPKFERKHDFTGQTINDWRVVTYDQKSNNWILECPKCTQTRKKKTGQLLKAELKTCKHSNKK